MAPKPVVLRNGLRRLHSAASAVKRLFNRRRVATIEEEPARFETAQRSPRQQPVSQSSNVAQGRGVRPDADIPLDVLDRTYIPQHTSSKTSFRSDGRDHQRDQEFALGVADDGWNDEDHFTNRSGDPRIGTHRRTYEPGESRDESRE